MTSEERMMQDYDYHQHTGELPEYFGDGKRGGSSRQYPNSSSPNNGCLYLFLFVLVFGILIWSLLRSYSDNDNKSSDHVSPSEEIDMGVNEDSPSVPLLQRVDTLLTQEHPIQQEEPSQQYEPSTKIREYSAYDEGYDQGYEDGEADAVDGGGWEASFDDDCHYKGKKRHEYQRGYEEGYEAGYYDNRDDE